MEENKPFMPPPPPKMPPLPPRGQMPGQMQSQVGVDSTLQSPQPPVQNEQSFVENGENKNVSSPIETNVSVENSQLQEVKPATKKEPMSKEKKKNALTTALYWGGFVLCLVGIALCIFFIVK